MKIDVDKMKGIAQRLGLGPRDGHPSKCLVIGGSPSLKGRNLGAYVDRFDGDVIRINAPVQIEYIRDCGARTDVLFTSYWMDENVFRADLCHKIVIGQDDIDVVSADVGLGAGLFLTTGTACILLALSTYDRVETLGFGDDGNPGSKIYISTHNDGRRVVKGSAESPHDIDKEHGIIAELRNGQFKGKLLPLEATMAAGVLYDREPCWDRFDRKVIVSYTGHKYTRVPAVLQELRRVGMDNIEVQWQFPTPINNILLRGMKHVPNITQGGYFNCGMGHYRAISTAYHLGCREALFMEDDIRFLKDTSIIPEVVKSIPDDYDVALFELSYRDDPWHDRENYRVWRDGRKANDLWSEFDRMYSMACYAVSRRGMERLMYCFEAVETCPKKGLIRLCDHYLDRSILGSDMRLYFNRKNICIQQRLGGASSNMDVMFERYRNMGLDMSEYNE